VFFHGCSFQLPLRFKNRAFKSQDNVRSPRENIKSYDHNSQQKYNTFRDKNAAFGFCWDWLGWASVNNHAASLANWRPCKNRPQHLAQIQRLGVIWTPPSGRRGRSQSWQWFMGFPKG
jgi:hypothetical protein